MSDNRYHQRFFVLHYDEKSLPRFETDEGLQDFYAALGRMMFYGLHREATEDLVDIVTAGITQNPLEITAAYHRPLPARDKWEDGTSKYIDSNSEACDELVKKLTHRAREQGRAFVMGAVKHNDGKFGFHS